MELTLITAVTVALIAFSSTVASQHMCGSEICADRTECRPVRVCSAADDSTCSLQPKCVAKSLVLEPDKQTCLSGQQPILRVVNFRFYTTVPCDQCMGDNSQCVNGVCCSPLPAGRSDPDGVSPECRPSCRMGCQYGMETDSQGCPLCSCYEPCRNMTCPAGWRCHVSGADQCRGPVCSGLSTSCVVDPCYGATCPDGQRCTVCTNKENCPSAGYTCQAGDPGLCSGVTCRMLCPYGKALDHNGCEMCHCAKSPCEDKVCPQNEVCRVDSTACSSGTCYTARCAPGSGDPGLCSGVTCRMLCKFGKALDHNGCEMCQCAKSPCEDKVCPEHEVCEVESTACYSGTCYKARCVPGPRTEVCPPVVCRMHCQFGWARDSLTGCEICSCKEFPDVTPDLCNDPNTPKCPPGTRCEMRLLQCVRQPCLAVPVCLALPAPIITTTTPSPTPARPLVPRIGGSCPKPRIGDWNEQWCGTNYRSCPDGRTCCPSFVPGIQVCRVLPNLLDN